MNDIKSDTLTLVLGFAVLALFGTVIYIAMWTLFDPNTIIAVNV